MLKLLIAALAGATLASPVAAQTLIHGVNGLQVGADGRIERFSGLVIGEDGKVMRLLGKSDPLPSAGVKDRIDGKGRTLLPGLIDGHGHVLGLGQAALNLDLTGTASIEDLKRRLASYAEANPGTGWIVGRGWNQELWPEGRMPTAADLDMVVADRPVWLGRVDGHAAVGNSAALKAAGITRSTVSPEGGRIEKDEAGNPTGLFVDAAEELVQSAIPAPSPADLDRALAEAQRIMLSNGVTAVADMGTTIEGWNALRRAGEADRLNVRVMAYAAALDPLTEIRRPTDWLYADRLRMAGVKLYSDGALGSRGAWLKAPYHDDPANRGLRFLSDAQLRFQVRKAADSGFQLAIHAIGDAANDQVISMFEELASRHPGDRRWRIEHVQILDPADISRIAKAGIIASMQPIHQVSDRTMAEARLGPGRLEGAYAWSTLARAGVPLAFGSDFPVEPVNPFLGLSAATSRQDPAGDPPGGWRPKERLTLAQALSGFTRGAAHAGFAESRIGSLEPGKWADFIIVDRDPSAVDAQALAATEVLETWVAGRRLYLRD